MYNLLVVDDDPVFEFIIEKTFRKSTLFNNVNFFSQAKDALLFLEENKLNADALPDLILLDIYMPVVNGWDFMKRFEEMTPTLKKAVPVYILTSSINPLDIKLSTNFKSIQSFISKPLTRTLIDNIYDFCKACDSQNLGYLMNPPQAIA